MTAPLPTRADIMPQWCKSVIRWGVLWFLLTLASVSIHAFTWMAAAPSSAAEPEYATWKILGNVLAMPTAPGWFAMVRIMGGLNGSSLRFAIGASLIGWMPWLIAAWTILRLRARLLRVSPITRDATPRSSVRPQPAPDGIDARSSDSTPEPETTSRFSRRRLLVDGAGSAVVVVGAGGYAHATIQEPWAIRVREFTVPIKDLPASLDGLVLSVVADLHYGPRVPAAHVEHAIAAAIAINADIDLLLGDYIHNGPTFMPRVIQLMQPLIARGRSIGIMGNHESYFGGFATNAALLGRSGIMLLQNQRAIVRRSAPGQPVTITQSTPTDAPDASRDGLVIAGVEDLWTQSPSANIALEGIPADVPRVVLSHHPDYAEASVFASRNGKPPSQRADLILSGHTHGGQVSLPLIGAPIVPSDHGQKYRSGLCNGPACPVIVTNGIGVSLLPIRIGVPPEVLKVTLTRANVLA
ncbi:MAG: metallophosphoesterase [Phycisphaerales bacterium]|nr:metallophosphoesterase [Phycisphaerales bacterium]